MLSPQQALAWTAAQEDAAIGSGCGVSIAGRIDPERLRAAFRQASARHEIFRTTFHRPLGVKAPLQVIGDEPSVNWSEEKINAGDLDAWREGELKKPFDLENGPLLRASLAMLPGDRAELLITLPAACADRLTMQNLVREIAADCGCSLERDIEAEPLQYADFAQWLGDQAASEGYEAQSGEAHWRNQQASSLPIPALPVGKTGARDSRFAPESISLDVPAQALARLQDQAAAAGVSMEAVLFAAWTALLSRLSAQTEFLMYRLAPGRHFEPWLATACGAFAQWVPMACQVDASATLLTLAGNAASAIATGDEWLAYLKATDAGTTAPIIGFEFVNEAASFAGPDLKMSLAASFAWSRRIEAALVCRATGESVSFAVDFDASLVDRQAIRRVGSYFERFLASAAGSPALPVYAHGLLSDEEVLLLTGVNGTVAPPPQASISQLFEKAAELHPSRPALIFGNQTLTYSELNIRANRIAHYLRAKGVKANIPVGLCTERSAEMIVGLLAIMKAGGAYVPLHPDQPKARLAYQLEETAAPVLLTQECLIDKLPPFGGMTFCLDRDLAQIADLPESNPEQIHTLTDLVYVIYTSGSTGVPKGVAVRHENLANYTNAICDFIGARVDAEPVRFATVSTISADLGNTCIFPALVSGGSLEVRSYESSIDGVLYSRESLERPIDVLKITPSNLRALLVQGDPKLTLPRKVLLLGGEALSWDLVEEIQRMGTCRVINHYGPTETTVGSLTYPITSEALAARRSDSVPIGGPIFNTAVYVVDSFLNLVPQGTPGELCIGGAGLSSGYLKQPEQTAERFVPNPFDSKMSTKVYRTGDKVRMLADGNIEFLGRLDSQVKIRGYRVELAEIERAIAAHIAVREVAVVAYDQGGEKRLAAYIVWNSNAASVEELRASLLDRLPDYMVPVNLITLPFLPLNANGKVDRRGLPDPGHASASVGVVTAPLNETQETLVRIWREVIGAKEIGIESNFFELGGHSLMATQVISRIRSAFDVQLPLRILFEKPTVGALAEAIDEAGRDNDKEMAKILAEIQDLSDDEVRQLLENEN